MKILNGIWTGVAVFLPAALVAIVAVEATPHIRGIGYLPELRYAVTTSVCALAAMASAFLYEFLAARDQRPDMTFRGAIFAGALVSLLLIAFGRGPALAGAAAPVICGVAFVFAVLVPRWARKPRRLFSTVVTAALSLFAIYAVFVAFGGERRLPPGPGQMAFDIPRSVFDGEHKFVDLPSGARVHYIDEGSGDVILFLHGNPSSSLQWRHMIMGLRGTYRTIALDYPGFGLSPLPSDQRGYTVREQSRVVEEFVNYLQLHDITLVMQDWGGPIGLGFAERRPDLVRQIVIGNSWAWPSSTDETLGKFSMIAGGPIGEFAQMNFNGFVYVAVAHDMPEDLPPEVTELYMGALRPLNRRGIAAFYPGQILGAQDYFEELQAGIGAIRDKRALFLWGMQDPGFPPTLLNRFEQTFPNHRTVELAHAGHFFMENEPEQVTGEIGAFMAPQETSADEPTR